MRKKPYLQPCAGWKPNKSPAQGNALGTMSPFPTPCKGKSRSQPFAHTFALTGRERLYSDTQGVALGWGLVALSGRSFSRFVRLSCMHASPLVVWQKKRAEIFLDFEHPTFNIGRAEKQIRYFAHPGKRRFPTSKADGQYRIRICQRTSSQTRPNLHPDATESAPRHACICSRVRWMA